jgi:hypothetical protein
MKLQNYQKNSDKQVMGRNVNCQFSEPAIRVGRNQCWPVFRKQQWPKVSLLRLVVQEKVREMSLHDTIF